MTWRMLAACGGIKQVGLSRANRIRSRGPSHSVGIVENAAPIGDLLAVVHIHYVEPETLKQIQP